MTTDQGGLRAPLSNKRRSASTSGRRRLSRFAPTEVELVIEGKPHPKSKRKVRKIVTVSGRGARGRFPSYKGRLIEYESLVELDKIRVLVVAASVTSITTQPAVFQLTADGKIFNYTPDIIATIGGREFVIEVKANNFSKNSQTMSRLRDIIAHIRRENVPFLLATESDVRPDGLQQELKLLLRERPAPGRFDPDLDANEWDPRHLQTVDPEILRRWREAQAACDALIQRLIRRDPGAFLDTLAE